LRQPSRPLHPEDTHVPSNQQRREAERRRLQRQLEERRAREAARKRTTLIASIIGTVVVIAAVIVIVVVTVGGSDNNTNNTAKDSASPSTSTSTSASASTAPTTPVPTPTAPCAAPQGATVSFKGLTVSGATDLKHEPKVSGKSAAAPTTIECRDLVVGKGAVAAANSSVTAQYVGLVYQTGKVFQSSWGSGQNPVFTLAQGQVIDGFYQGIGGAGKVGPMHVGGRRIIIMPAALAYGANPPSGSGIPANAALVFVVDLQKVG
jgi:cytoskeletal protein RodZ